MYSRIFPFKVIFNGQKVYLYKGDDLLNFSYNRFFGYITKFSDRKTSDRKEKILHFAMKGFTTAVFLLEDITSNYR